MQEQLESLQWHWGDAYDIFAPSADCLQWLAVAKFGMQDMLTAETARELRAKIRNHYPNYPRHESMSL